MSWVRRVVVEGGGLSYDDAEDGVTFILLSYYRRTGDCPWKQSEPDVFLLRTLCHDYASAYWRKQKRREHLLEGWDAPSLEGYRNVEAIAISEMCAQEFLDALSPRLRAVARLRLQGDTCAQIAQSLGVSPGTVQAYLRDLRQLFKKFFGYDPTKRGSRDSNSYGKLDGKEGMKDENSQTDMWGGAVILHKWVLLTLTLCLTTQALGSEPHFVVTMRFEGNENRNQEFFDGRSQSQAPTARLWQGQDVFSTSLAVNATGGLKKSTARLEGTLTIVRIRWTGDAQTPPPEVTKWVIGWRQGASLSAGSGVQYSNTNVSTASVSGETPPGTYTDSVSHSGYGSSTGGRPQNDPWVGREFFEVSGSQFTWNPAGWWETGENLLSRTIKMDVSAQITVPHGYNTANATLYLQAVVTTKFVTIGPDTWKKGADSQGNPIPVLNTPDEGDTAVRLTYNLWRQQWEWTTDITHQLDFKPSIEAWHLSSFCPGLGAPSFLTNPDILWSTIGAHNVDINDAWPTSICVMQNYGAYIPYNMPSLSNYSLRVRVTDNTDGFTDVAEKRMRVHFPIEEWQRHWTRLHPLPECPTYPDNYRPDWNFVGIQTTGLSTGVERTFTVSESRTVSNTGTIGTESGLQVGTEEAKVAFKTYENIETGVSYNVSCSATQKYTMYPGFRYYEFWAYQWEEKAGICQIYGVNGYQGESMWWAAEYLRLPGNSLSIRLYVYAEPVSPP
jgi:DNA-directed RNA polymerase specialized sigma24 family protein